MRTLDAYFDFGSPYSYLAWCRVQAHPARYAGARVAWRPVSAAHLFQREGTKPNAAFPNLLRYNRADLVRWAAAYGVPLAVPPSFPTRTIDAGRIHLVAEAAGRGDAWLAAGFRAHWVDGRDIGDAAVLADLARAVGIPEAPARAGQEDVKRRLVANTDEAYAAGAPGVPYFVLDGDGYWGNDRLEWVEARLAGRAHPVCARP